MRRRQVLAFVASAAAWPIPARAQSLTKGLRLAFVDPAAPVSALVEGSDIPWYGSFFAELRRLGYVEGHNLSVERYSGEGQSDRYPILAREVVRSAPDAIVTVSSTMMLQFKAATMTIPIVGITADPIALGVVNNLARPGGNITGVVADAGIEIWSKRLQLLTEFFPTASRIALLIPRFQWDHPFGQGIRDQARLLGLALHGAVLESPIQPPEFRRVFAGLTQQGTDALAVAERPEHYVNRVLIVELAAQARLPTIYPDRIFVTAGGLFSYGVRYTELFRRMAGQVSEIWKGTPPGEIPMSQPNPTDYELVLSIKAAEALGLTIPPTLLARADEVIE